MSKVAGPTFSEDGIPTIRAPDSVRLGTSKVWKDHIVAFFHGTPPSPTKIFNDLNPIWGKKGRIAVKYHSARARMIYIPCEQTRKWALEVGFWHSGNCSFTVLPWSPSMNLSPMKLVHAPVWVLFKQVPQELWSLEGFNSMASGVGIPVYSEFPQLTPYTNGIIKLKVVIELANKRPTSVRITDKEGYSVLVSCSFPRLPPFCTGCSEFGHFQLRCPEPYLAKSGGSQAESKRGHSKAAESKEGSSSAASKALATPTVGKKLARSASLPTSSSRSLTKAPSGDWTTVAYRSKVKKVSNASVSSSPQAPLNSLQLAEEEEMVKVAQEIIRKRLTEVEPSISSSLSGADKKKTRRRQRQKNSALYENPAYKGNAFLPLSSDLDPSNLPFEQEPPGPVLSSDN